MPIWLRRLTFNYVNEFYIKEKEDFEKSIGKEQITPTTDFRNTTKNTPKVTFPDFVSKVKRGKK